MEKCCYCVLWGYGHKAGTEAVAALTVAMVADNGKSCLAKLTSRESGAFVHLLARWSLDRPPDWEAVFSLCSPPFL